MARQIFLPTANTLVTKALDATISMYAWMRDVTKAVTDGGGPAPADATYHVCTADPDLPNARVATDTATVTLDYTTPGQVKWNAVGGGTVTDVTGIPPISSTGGTTPAISLDDTAVTPGTYGDGTNVAQFTVDQKGRLTFAQNVSITGISVDHVVMSNGANPPSPMDDGAGNFIYIPYVP